MDLGRLAIGGVLHVLSARVSGSIIGSVGNIAIEMESGSTLPICLAKTNTFYNQTMVVN